MNIIGPDALVFDGRVHPDLELEWNAQAFGHPNGGEMNFGCGDRVRMQARLPGGALPFGTIEQQVVRSTTPKS